MFIREAQASDAHAIHLLLTQLGYPAIDEKIAREKIRMHSQPGYHLLVAELEGRVVGFISLHSFELMHWQGKMGRMTAFCVDETCRSKGVGSALLQASENYFVAQGCVKFEVTSNARRTRTHGFYLKHGYVEDSRRFVRYLH
jgi:N-acetylglutamate synthase-like GNAT family acetyltransferase